MLYITHFKNHGEKRGKKELIQKREDLKITKKKNLKLFSIKTVFKN